MPKICAFFGWPWNHSKHNRKYRGSIHQVVRVYVSKHCLNYLTRFTFLEGSNVLYPSCILVPSSFPTLAQNCGQVMIGPPQQVPYLQQTWEYEID